MRKIICLGSAAAAILLLCTSRPVSAIALTEGGASQTINSISALPTGDALVASSPAANFNIAGVQMGTIISQVYSHTGGTYDFVYQLNMSGASAAALTGNFIVYDFDPYTVDESYLAGSGATFGTGQFMSNGYVLASTVVLVGQSTDPLVIQTNAKNYAFGGSAPGYTLGTIYEPAVPEPATFSLFAAGLSVLSLRRGGRSMPSQLRLLQRHRTNILPSAIIAALPLP